MNLLDVKLSLDKVDAFIFDFDGVLTNNLVYLNEDGTESVCCSRSDGLAFDVLRKLNKPAYILSTEKNPVVTARAKKIEVPVFQGKGDKVQTLRYISDEEGLDLKNVLYTGNDINDYKAVQLCGYKACPSDSHKVIKQISTIELKTKGGLGVVRELLEDVFGLDFIEILYKE